MVGQSAHCLADRCVPHMQDREPHAIMSPATSSSQPQAGRALIAPEPLQHSAPRPELWQQHGVLSSRDFPGRQASSVLQALLLAQAVQQEPQLGRARQLVLVPQPLHRLQLPVVRCCVSVGAGAACIMEASKLVLVWQPLHKLTTS